MSEIKKILSTITQIAFFVVLFAQSSSLSAALPVKQSSSGICHSPESGWYERTTNYTGFDSIESCLDAGGRLPKGSTLATLNREYESEGQGGIPKYRRSAFGHGWDDADRDCQDSRAEALIDTSTTPVRFADGQRCRVVTGRWVSPFTGNVIQNSSEIDIDHVVPLAWAWERGARNWPSNKRERFANDPVNLLPVEASLNRSKGAQGPDKWLPPSGQCGYVARFSRIVKKYRLALKCHEVEWIQAFLNQCRN